MEGSVFRFHLCSVYCSEAGGAHPQATALTPTPALPGSYHPNGADFQTYKERLEEVLVCISGAELKLEPSK